MSVGLRVPLLKVLEHYLTPQQFKRYVNQDRTNQLASPQHFYNSALRDLSIRNTESALQNLIKIFDIEPKHVPSLHLARTMLFGLNKLFQEAGGELYRSKFPNLNSYRQRLESQIEEKELEQQRLRNDIAQTEAKKGLFGGLFGGNKRQNRVAQLQQQQQQVLQQLQQLQQRRTKIMKLVQVQEYANVISLVLEVCMFPARYSWLSVQDNKSEVAQGKGYDAQVWYG